MRFSHPPPRGWIKLSQSARWTAGACSVGLIGLAVVLVLSWLFVSALTVCLNESPRYATVSEAAVPWLWAAARGALAMAGVSSSACEPSLLARVLGLASAAYLGAVVLLDGGRVPRQLGLGVVLGVALVCHVVLF